MKDELKIGIDLGGTKIEIAVLNSKNEIIFKKRSSTPRHDYRNTILEITSLTSHWRK